MDSKLLPLCIRPNATLRDAMQAMTDGPRSNPASPSGIALVMEGTALLGIATDGDIRKAILDGRSLEESVETVMKKMPLTVLHDASPDIVLARFHDVLRTQNLPESRFHHIITVDEKGEVVDILSPFELWRRSEVKIKTVSVIGLGYVGLTLALTLNEFGIRVIGVDVQQPVIDTLNAGIPHFYEKGLEQLLKKHAQKNLILSTTLSENQSDIFIICVGTPVSDKGDVTMSYLQEAVTEVGKLLKPHDLVILRSTVPIGTCRNFVIPILEQTSGMKAGADFFLSFAPERTVEGKALEELRTLPQVIGGLSKQSFDETSKFFRIFTNTIVAVDTLEEAEAVKLLNNTFRDVSFGFANEVAQMLGGHDLNARKVIKAANEGYVRNHIPSPSPGVGGACLVKDPYLFMASAKGYIPKIPAAARSVNEAMIGFVTEKVRAFLQKTGKNASAKIFLAGMAFKGLPETSDIRHSTSVDILRLLQKTYNNISIFDHVAHADDLAALGSPVASSLEEGFANADCALVLNNHPAFGGADIFTLASSMRRPGMIFDPWGSFREEQLTGVDGVAYAGL